MFMISSLFKISFRATKYSAGLGHPFVHSNIYETLVV